MVSYITGFFLSLALILIAYFSALYHWFSPFGTVAALICLAIFQALIQLLYFFHLDDEKRPRFKQMIFALTVLVVLLPAGGTHWIMRSLAYNMMG